MNNLVLKIDKFLNESEEISDKEYKNVVDNCLILYKKLNSIKNSKQLKEYIELCEQLLEYFKNNKQFTPKHKKLISLMFKFANKFINYTQKNNDINESIRYNEINEKNGKITKKQMAKNAFFSGKNFWNLNKLNLTAGIVGAALAVTGASSILIPAALATAIIGGSVTAILHSLYKDNKENKRTKKEETAEDIVKADKEITKKNVNDCFETLEKLISNFNKKEKINTKEKQILKYKFQ